jgi:hypothetical protein
MASIFLGYPGCLSIIRSFVVGARAQSFLAEFDVVGQGQLYTVKVTGYRIWQADLARTALNGY